MCKKTFSLYVHIPFCLRKCPYCDFNSIAVPAIPEEEYLVALKSELGAYRHRQPWAGRQAGTIYFGGGTPSLLRPSLFSELLNEIDRLFGIADRAEITLEANPASKGETKYGYSGFLAAGINRLSLGAQSFDDQVLARLGRLHSSRETVDTLEEADRAGFSNIGIDLIFGVPGQSARQWEQDLSRCLELDVAHVSTYELTIEPGTSFHTLERQGLLEKQLDDDVAEMYAMVRAGLQSEGYKHYEISNFARPGRESRHNLAYWRRHPYLGIGAGSHSFDPTEGWGKRWSNERRLEAYMDRVTRGGTATVESEELSQAQAVCEFLFLGLRLLEGIDPRLFEAQFQAPIARLLPETASLLTDGLLAIKGEQIALSEKGLYLADAVLARLLRS